MDSLKPFSRLLMTLQQRVQPCVEPSEQPVHNLSTLLVEPIYLFTYSPIYLLTYPRALWSLFTDNGSGSG